MQKKALLILFLCSVVLFTFTACSTSGATSNAPGTVHMSDTAFTQSTVTIKKGESITLIADTFTTQIIANGTWKKATAQPAKEAGAPAVNNVQIASNSSASIGPFTTAGTFHLYCTVHVGMELTVVVQ
ncbi:hypothetical protein KSF_003200 [Reticulibacter mediterranei]|uniref:Blue (type 1) copper domain-containing protein n=1 Tax=Reticulibacter mediterranei TaxID=2778369 RepID=A0A8J3N0H2_9CHLR|nr:hypothetical protein [Reticulibacter mediterranei]GHO90272.1 hypothetical protein KSF_003200 [Reticulibacter mediterranei]